MTLLNVFRGRMSRSSFSHARKGRPQGSRKTPRKLLLELLEDRTLPSTYIVTNTNDSGPGSLRQAIIDANTNATGTAATPDLIQFNIPATDLGHLYYRNDGVAGQVSLANIAVTIASDDSTIADIDPDWAHSWWSIQPPSLLPAITDIVTIDGYSQAGASQNTLANADNAILRIELNGSQSGGGNSTSSKLLTVTGGWSTVQGLVINGFPDSVGIYLSTNGYNHVQGNFIGTDVSGTLAPNPPNLSALAGGPQYGVAVQSQHNWVGTNGDGANDASERNVISGNFWGVVLRGSSTIVSGNLIGTDRTGLRAVPNWIGFGAQLASGDRIGISESDADPAAERNVVSGNNWGIGLLGGGPAPGDSNAVIAGNWIGLDVEGNSLGNLHAGVVLSQGDTSCTIGGATAASANIIAFNGGPGVWVATLQSIGIPGIPVGNRIQGNSIYRNGGLGIDLGGDYTFASGAQFDGVTLNDSAGHSGPNNFQNFPVLTSAFTTPTTTTVTGTFSESAEPNTSVMLDFYANASLDPSGYGEGETYLGSWTVTTDSGGNARFTAVLNTVVPTGEFITATATDPSGNTSEFSLGQAVAFTEPDLFASVRNYSYSLGQFPLYPVMATGDFDGKNGPDLAFADGGNDNYLTLLLNNGDGTFGSPVSLNVGSPVSGPDGLAAGDFDGNGKVDLAVATYYDNSVTMLLNYDAAQGVFQGTFTFSAPQAQGLAVIDLNDNGSLDLAVTDYTDNTITLLLDFNPASHTFGSAATYSTDLYPISIAAGDFNGDGKTDLAVACAGSVDFFLGNGNGTFAPSVAFANPYNSTLATADFNGDGKVDLVIANFLGGDGGVYVTPSNPGANPNSLTVLLGNADLGQMFQSAASYPIGTNVLSAVVGDFNGDGKADVAVTSAGGFPDNGSPPAPGQFGMSVVPGNSDGTFGTTRLYGPNMFTFYAAAADFNRDGKVDVAVFGGNDILRSYTSANVSVFLNQVPGAGGSYTVAEGYSLNLQAATPANPDGVTWTYSWDVNGDGVFGDATGANPTISWSGLEALGITDGPRTISDIQVRISDSQGDIFTSAPTALSLVNGPPTPSFNGPTSGVPNQSLTFTVGANDPSTADQAAGFAYVIDWGDGTPQNPDVQMIPRVPGNGAAFQVSHPYAQSGSFTIQVSAADKDGGVSQPTTAAVDISNVQQSGTSLIVGGEGTISLTPGSIIVTINGQRIGEYFGVTGAITIFGGPANDTITVDRTITNPTTIYSGGGNDTLRAGGGTNTLVGGSGTTTFIDNGGTNTIIGGTGGNIFVPGGGQNSFQLPPAPPAPIVFNDNYSAVVNGVLNVAVAGVLANDLSANGEAITAVLLGGPSHGSLTLNANGGFQYTPSAGYTGSDSFTYQAKGSDGALSATALVSLRVNYNFGGFLAPLSNNLAFNQNRTIPIKWQLRDAAGNLITSLSAITSLQVAPVLSGGGLGTPFNPTPSGGTALRNDGTQYVFNWDTKNVAVGTYKILLTLADGTGQTKTLQIVTKGGYSGLLIDGTNATAATGGLLGGDIALYVDNASGLLTSDERARIDEAVAAVDGVIGAYGVTVTEVSDSASANVVLDMGSTSAVGGYADGVLGCTTDAGEITLISGWSWYAGANAAGIGSGQYDFETVVVHELGHALGLGHSSDSTSVMYATLNTGAVRRSLTSGDLNVPGDGDPADGLHAALNGGWVSEPSYGNIGRVGDPSYNGGRDMIFAFGAAQPANLALGSRQLPGTSGEPGRADSVTRDALFAAVPAEWPPHHDGALPAANVSAKSRNPIYAAGPQRPSDDPLIDALLLPVPSQDGQGDGFAPAGGTIAEAAGQVAGFIAADPNWLDD